MPTLLSANNYYYFRGGAESVFLNHNSLFERQGWKVVPFAMRHPKNLETSWSSYFVEEIEFDASYKISEKLIRLPRVIYSYEARRKLSRLLDESHPNLCHAHNIYHHISPSILGLLKERQIPTVLTLHDLKIACPAYTMLAHDGICERCRNGRLYNVVIHRCIKNSVALSTLIMIEAVLHRLIGSYRDCVDRFVAPSHFIGAKLVDWGLPEQTLRYVPNFVSPEQFTPSCKPGDRFVYFGRLSREKGLHTLMRAAAIEKSKLTIIGTGPELESLRKSAAELHVDVRFMGYLTGPKLREEVAAARAVVLPSECYENAPMAILEAYALGKLVIGADIGGIPELISEGKTGFRFASGSVAGLAQILGRVRDSRNSDLEELGYRGRRWVESDFSSEMYCERMLNVYHELGVG